MAKKKPKGEEDGLDDILTDLEDEPTPETKSKKPKKQSQSNDDQTELEMAMKAKDQLDKSKQRRKENDLKLIKKAKEDRLISDRAAQELAKQKLGGTTPSTVPGPGDTHIGDSIVEDSTVDGKHYEGVHVVKDEVISGKDKKVEKSAEEDEEVQIITQEPAEEKLTEKELIVEAYADELYALRENPDIRYDDIKDFTDRIYEFGCTLDEGELKKKVRAMFEDVRISKLELAEKEDRKELNEIKIRLEERGKDLESKVESEAEEPVAITEIKAKEKGTKTDEVAEASKLADQYIEEVKDRRPKKSTEESEILMFTESDASTNLYLSHEVKDGYDWIYTKKNGEEVRAKVVTSGSKGIEKLVTEDGITLIQENMTAGVKLQSYAQKRKEEIEDIMAEYGAADAEEEAAKTEILEGQMVKTILEHTIEGISATYDEMCGSNLSPEEWQAYATVVADYVHEFGENLSDEQRKGLIVLYNQAIKNIVAPKDTKTPEEKPEDAEEKAIRELEELFEEAAQEAEEDKEILLIDSGTYESLRAAVGGRALEILADELTELYNSDENEERVHQFGAAVFNNAYLSKKVFNLNDLLYGKVHWSKRPAAIKLYNKAIESAYNKAVELAKIRDKDKIKRIS